MAVSEQVPRRTGTEAPTLEGLRAQYGDRYRIWRTRTLWVANPVDPDLAPTIMDTDLGGFVRQLRTPPPRAGRPLPPASLGLGGAEP